MSPLQAHRERRKLKIKSMYPPLPSNRDELDNGWSISFRLLQRNFRRSFLKDKEKQRKSGFISDYKPVKSKVFYQNRHCYLYGVLNKEIGYKTIISQSVYYDRIDNKLILNCEGTLIAWHFESIHQYVTKTNIAK